MFLFKSRRRKSEDFSRTKTTEKGKQLICELTTKVDCIASYQTRKLCLFRAITRTSWRNIVVHQNMGFNAMNHSKPQCDCDVTRGGELASTGAGMTSRGFFLFRNLSSD